MANERERRKRERLSARETAEKQAAGWESNLFKMPPECKAFEVKQVGVRRIDILPFIAGKGNPYREPGLPHYERTFYAHTAGVGVENKRFVCPAKTIRRPCPICEYRRDLATSGDADSEVKELMKKLSPKRRQLWMLYDLDKFDEGMFIWEVAFHNFGRLVNDAINASDIDDEYEFFSDLEDGLTLKVAFEEGHFNGKTFFQPNRIDFKRRKENYDPNLIDSLPCLDDILNIESYDKLREELYQTANEDEDNDADEEPPRPRSSAAKSKSKPAPVDDDDDDEPVRKPKRSSPPEKASRKSADEDDDEEEEKPTKKANSKDDCTACEGSGKNSRGRTCRICEGSGHAKAKDEEDEEDDPPVKSSRRSRPPVEEDDDEEEERPAKSSSKKSRRPVEDDDEDEEEDPKPRRSSKTKERVPADGDNEDDDDDWKDWDK